MIVAASFGANTHTLTTSSQGETKGQEQNNVNREKHVAELQVKNEKEEGTESKALSSTSNQSVEEFFKVCRTLHVVHGASHTFLTFGHNAGWSQATPACKPKETA